jgi:hypothetical protein
MNTAGTEKRRSTEQRNTVTMGVAATQDSTSEWREDGAQVSSGREAAGKPAAGVQRRNISLDTVGAVSDTVSRAGHPWRPATYWESILNRLAGSQQMIRHPT